MSNKLPPLTDLFLQHGAARRAAWLDLHPAANWLQYAIAAIWTLRRIIRRGDTPRLLYLPHNGSYSCGQLLAELRRLHIDACPVLLTASGFTVLVGAKQHRFADYTLRRLLSGAPIPAWRRS